MPDQQPADLGVADRTQGAEVVAASMPADAGHIVLVQQLQPSLLVAPPLT